MNGDVSEYITVNRGAGDGEGACQQVWVLFLKLSSAGASWAVLWGCGSRGAVLFPFPQRRACPGPIHAPEAEAHFGAF